MNHRTVKTQVCVGLVIHALLGGFYFGSEMRIEGELAIKATIGF